MLAPYTSTRRSAFSGRRLCNYMTVSSAARLFPDRVLREGKKKDTRSENENVWAAFDIVARRARNLVDGLGDSENFSFGNVGKSRM